MGAGKVSIPQMCSIEGAEVLQKNLQNSLNAVCSIEGAEVLQKNLQNSLNAVQKYPKELFKKIPDAYCCPIAGDGTAMIDPVILCGDEHTYERAQIVRWLEDNNTSPYTRAVLQNRQLIANVM